MSDIPDLIVVDDPDDALDVRAGEAIRQVPVVDESGQFLGYAGYRTAGALAVLRRALGEEVDGARRVDVACLYQGDHAPRPTRAIHVPGDKRDFVICTAWVRVRGASAAARRDDASPGEP